MNLKSTLLLKLLPLLTFIALLFPTPKIAQAAGSAPAQIAPAAKKVLKEDSYGEEYAAAPSKGAEKTTGVNKLSDEAMRIKFLTFCGVIGSFLLLPEVFYRKGKDEEQPLSDESTHSQPEEPAKNSTPDLDFLKTISAKTKDVDSFSKNSETSNGTVESQKNHKSA